MVLGRRLGVREIYSKGGLPGFIFKRVGLVGSWARGWRWAGVCFVFGFGLVFIKGPFGL